MGAHSAPRRKPVVKTVFSVAILVASMFTLARATAGAATAYSTVQPGTFTGYAFDACTAPPSASMAAWRASSPYRGIGIYIGGNNRGCTQANLTAEWVQEQVTAGWKLLPLYVGPQATCTTTTKKNYIDNANATAHGRDTATDAVAQAAALGLAKQSVLIYDMEAYRTNDAACRQGVLAFMNGWTSRLHDLGYFSGFYSSVSSGVADQVANYNAPGYAPPDYMDFARWDNVVTLEDPVIPAGYWSPHRRMKQYRGPAKETYGGVTINIDLNYVDFAPLPAAKLADFSGNGWSDVLARYPGNGNLYLYPGNGSTVGTGSARRTLSGGWNSMNAIVRIGDLNKDGKEDVVARQTNGDLWFYPGTGTGFGTRKKLATGWGGLREITAVGDLNGDGYPDLAAIESSTNKLFLYPGRSGTKLGTRGPISGGWRTYRELAGVGDFNRDGLPDMAARDNADAGLYVYLGRKGGFQGRIKVGSGWNGMRDVLGVGDFNRDGFTDLAAIRGSDSSLMLYRGTGSSLKAGVRLTPLTGYAPLA